MKTIFLSVILAALANAESFIIGTGSISGAPGSTIGWGFSASSNTYYMLIVNVALLPAPSIGVFTDLLSTRPTFEVGPPPSPFNSVTEVFNAGLGTGLASFAINGSAPVGSVASGSIFVTYDLYSRSPNFDPLFDPFTDTVSNGTIVEIPVTITVTPEPGTALSLLSAAVAGIWWHRRRIGVKDRSHLA